MRPSQEQITKANAIGKVLSHPLRLEVLAAVGRHGETSSSALSRGDRMGTASVVNYHMQELLKVGAVRHERDRPVGPVREHLYALTPLGQAVLVLVADL